MGKKRMMTIKAKITVSVDESIHVDKFDLLTVKEQDILEAISAKCKLPGVRVFNIEPLNEDES